MTDDLAVWLEAALAEDEATIREMLRQLDDADENMDGGWHFWGGFGRLADRMIQPKRWLAECDSKRRIVEEHSPSDVGYCPRCEWRDDERDDPRKGDGSRWVLYPCLTLRRLAVPFADRPGYRQEWT